MPTSRGGEAFVRSSRATREAGFTDITFVPLEVRGDRLELSKVTARTVTGHEIVFLNVGQVDSSGLAVRTTSFDEDDLPAAITALEAWDLEDRPPPTTQ